MEKLSLKKKLLVIRLYFEGLSYDEIAAKTGVGKGSVSNVINELKAGRFPEYGDLSEQIELLRELAVDLKRTRLRTVQAAVGVSVLSRLQELGVEPGEIEGLSAVCRTLNADGIDIPSFVRAALAFEAERERTGLSVDELEAKVKSLQESATRLEPLAKEVMEQETRLTELTEQRESLAQEVSELKEQGNVLQDKVKDREDRETELSNRVRELEGRAQSADERLIATRKDLKLLSGIGMSQENLSVFTQRLKVIAQRHGIKSEVLCNMLMNELEQLDEGLGLDNVTRAKKEELSKLEKKILKEDERLATLRSEIEKLQEERSESKAVLSEERRHITKDIQSINTITRNTISEFKRDVESVVGVSIVEVNKLRDQALKLGKELGKYNEMIESNKWIRGLLALVKGDEVEPEQVRVIGVMVTRGLLNWMEHNSDNNALWQLKTYTTSLNGALERWIV